MFNDVNSIHLKSNNNENCHLVGYYKHQKYRLYIHLKSNTEYFD